MANILVVEDEKSINDLIVMNLKLAGHTCRQAFDGRQAQALFREQQPDLVLLDVMLPCGDGFSLMEQKVFGDKPVIFLTAKNGTTDKVKGLNLGDYHLFRPAHGFGGR